jgi:hypothetical protein
LDHAMAPFGGAIMSFIRYSNFYGYHI